MNTRWPWGGLGAALVGASSLHLAMAVALSDVSSHPTPDNDPAMRIEIRPVLLTPPLLAAPTDRSTDADMQVQSPAADRRSGLPTSIAELEIDTATPDGRRYFGVNEVDVPAVPRPEWQVDVPLLMGLGVHSFSVDVLIGETGIAEHCTLTRIEPEQPATVRNAVAAQLCETALSPAMRRGIAVPSVRHIELVLALP
ncbi:MAG: hypothetical protein QFE16_08135 [Pseudomonadota bacterium]|nr:hypothetical protein [Pseudomonadota bacterium]